MCSHVCVVCTCCVCVCCVCVVTHARNESVYNFFAQLAMNGVYGHGELIVLRASNNQNVKTVCNHQTRSTATNFATHSD